MNSETIKLFNVKKVRNRKNHYKNSICFSFSKENFDKLFKRLMFNGDKIRRPENIIIS